MAFTYFFRDMQTLQLIQEHALPVLRTKQHIKIWDAGCAMGPEPYSLSILIREKMGNMLFRNLIIKASDIDNSNLFSKIIEDGIYPKEQIDRIPSDILNKYFEQINERDFKISDEIRKSVVFLKHDLLSFEPIDKGFGLIMCKNVLLHFNEQERIKVYKMFYDALIEEGFLVTEQTQKLPKEVADLFEPIVSNAQIFRKKS